MIKKIKSTPKRNPKSDSGTDENEQRSWQNEAARFFDLLVENERSLWLEREDA